MVVVTLYEKCARERFPNRFRLMDPLFPEGPMVHDASWTGSY